MATQPLATWQDVQTWWRPLEVEEQAKVTGAIAFVTGLLRTKLPNVDTWVESGRVDPDAAKGVIVAAVLNWIRNPDNKITESSDDYSFRRADFADGRLRIDAEAVAALTPPAVDGASSAAGTLVLGQEDTTAVTPQVLLSPADYTYRDGGFT